MRFGGLVAVLLVAIAAPASGHEHMWIASTADGGGALSLSYDFARAFPTVAQPDGTSFLGTDPAFNALLADSPPSLHRLDDGTNVTMVIVSMDAEVSIVFNGRTLRAAGDKVKVGKMPYLHQHPQWRLTPPAGAVGSWHFAFRLESPTYATSPTYTAAVTNVVPATTTTTTSTVVGASSTTTLPSDTSTTTVQPGASTTTTLLGPGTTTTTSTLPTTACEPGDAAACDDGNACTDDACLAGGCVHVDQDETTGVACRLASMRDALMTSAPETRRGERTKARLLRLLVKVDRLVERAGAKPSRKTYGRAQRALARFAVLLDDAIGAGVLDAGTLAGVQSTAGDAATRLDALAAAADGGPRFAADVQPILTARCATAGCHQGAIPVSEPSLDAGRAWAALVGMPSLNVPSMVLVEPGAPSRSYLARKILGKRIPDRTARMPFGCPDVPPTGGCLSARETATIVAWIAHGATDD